jgi:hypothetical protein
MADQNQIDLPPGAPNYPAGPLATSFGAFRASGKNDLASFLAPKTPSLSPASDAPPTDSLAAHAASLGQRAVNGLMSIFGIGQPAAAPSISDSASLEGGLDKLQARSTTLAPNLYSQRAAPVTAKPLLPAEPNVNLNPAAPPIPGGTLNAFQLRALSEGKDRQA